jgi:L-aminoadipate-semialdehyde dehydrogenase
MTLTNIKDLRNWNVTSVWLKLGPERCKNITDHLRRLKTLERTCLRLSHEKFDSATNVEHRLTRGILEDLLHQSDALQSRFVIVAPNKETCGTSLLVGVAVHTCVGDRYKAWRYLHSICSFVSSLEPNVVISDTDITQILPTTEPESVFPEMIESDDENFNPLSAITADLVSTTTSLIRLRCSKALSREIEIPPIFADFSVIDVNDALIFAAIASVLLKRSTEKSIELSMYKFHFRDANQSRVKKSVLLQLEHRMIEMIHQILSLQQPIHETEFRPSLNVTVSSYSLPSRILPLLETTIERIPLQFSIWHHACNQITLFCDYDPNLYHTSTPTELLDQIDLVLMQFDADFNVKMGGLSLLTSNALSVLPDPRSKLNGEWPGPITQYLKHHATCHPNKLAIVYSSAQSFVTYGQLDRLTDLLAKHLIAKRDSNPQNISVIAIYGYRSPSLIWSIMSVLKSGAAYCIIDPQYPPHRIITLLHVARPCGCLIMDEAGLVHRKITNCLRDLHIWTMSIPSFEDAESINLEYLGDELPELSYDSIAVLTFTSGSTGIPKGVCGRHGPLTQLYPWMQQKFNLSNLDRFSVCSGIAHDPLQRDVFTPIFLGACMCLPPHSSIMQPGALAQWFASEAITVSCLTPAVGQLLSQTSLVVPSLRRIFFVGDSLTNRDVCRMQSVAPQAICINMYGSTETQRAVGFYSISPHSDMSRRKLIIPVGQGMQDVQLLILSPEGIRAGIGELGEIYVRSPHLAQGYLGDKATSESRFLPNPFALDGDPRDRLYRTGDVGRYLNDGSVECLGRIDEQVKIRGFRVELGEINAVLAQYELIEDNVTICKDLSIISYVVISSAVVEPKDSIVCRIRDYLVQKLPGYMVPAHIIVLPALPLTPNGKIDRQALPDILQVLAPNEHMNRECYSGTEAILLPIWRQVLNRPNLGLNDDIFACGGHSLLATELTLKMQQHLQCDLAYTMVYENPTLASFAAKLDRPESKDADLDLDREVMDEVESLLSDFVYTSSRRWNSTNRPKTILLTGATGFLGTFLVSSFLQMDASINLVCLARASDHEAARQRIIMSLQNHLVINSICQDWDERIKALAGDLEQPNLGLSTSMWTKMLTSVDAIVHNGALVHWIKPYRMLKRANVSGTCALLRLSLQAAIPFYFVSTTSVLDSDNLKKESFIEEAIYPDTRGLYGGYSQSKWVAEQIIDWIERATGLPTAIFRPGYIGGHSIDGTCNTDDFLCRLIKGCIQLQRFPFLKDQENEPQLNVVPVNVVSDIIAWGVLHSKHILHRGPIHVINPNPISYYDVYMEIQKMGYQLKLMSYPDWRILLQRDNDVNALHPLLAHFTPTWYEELVNRPTFGQRKLQEFLVDSKFPLLHLSSLTNMKAVIQSSITYLIRCEYLQAPCKDSIYWIRETNRCKRTLLSRTDRYV